MVATLLDKELLDAELVDTAAGSPLSGMPSAGSPDVAPLTHLVKVLASVSVVGLSEAGLRDVLDAASQVRRAAAGLVYRVGSEADRLSKLGKSAPSNDLLGEGGKSRGSSARRDSARAKTVSQTPGLKSAAGSGQVGSDQIDSLTRRLKDLTDEERSRLDLKGLVEKAKTMTADRFDKALREAVERARNDRGLKEQQTKHLRSEFRHWFDHKAGVGKFSGQLDPLRYEALTTAIDQHVNTLASAQHQSKGSALAAQALVDLVTSSGERSPSTTGETMAKPIWTI